MKKLNNKCPICGYKYNNPAACIIGNGKFRLCFACLHEITDKEEEQQLLFLMLHKMNQIHDIHKKA